MTMIKYAYKRNGGPILDWRDGVPRQTRAADAASLGSLGGTTLDHPTLVLPAPGAPEPVGVSSGMGCCSACSSGMGGITDSFPGGIIGIGVAAFIAWKVFGKKRR